MVLERTKLGAVRQHRHRGLAIALLLGLLAASGCDITDFQAPVLVGLDETIPVTVDVASLGDSVSAVDLHVMLRVPSGWSVQAALSTWSGTVNGSPASGTPAISSSNPSALCDFTSIAGAPPAGMKDVYFSESFASFLETDAGALDAFFKVEGATGTFQLLAATAAEDGMNGGCDDMATRDIRVLTAVPVDQPWALVGLALALTATGLLATRRLA